MGIFLQIVWIFFLILLNGYFVAIEYALIAVRKTRVDELAKKGSLHAKRVQKVSKDLPRYISATQLGITLASLAVGWVGEPAMADILEHIFSALHIPITILTLHAIAAGIAFFFITYIHIMFGELLPKAIALQKADTTSFALITPLIYFTDIFHIFISFLNGSATRMLRILGLHYPTNHKNTHSEEEIKMLLQQSSKHGLIPSREVEIVNNVFQLGDTTVNTIMVPKTKIIAFPTTAQLTAVVEQIKHTPHSRFPVYHGSLDNIIGFVHVKDIYQSLLKYSPETTVGEVPTIRKTINIPEVKKIGILLQEMRKQRIHMAIISDEYGETSGIVTLEDIIESLIGEIEDEFDTPTTNVIKQSDGSYLIQGQTLIEDLPDKFHFSGKTQEYATIGGLVFGYLGHEPHVGDTVPIGSYQFTVVSVDGKRIKEIKLQKEQK